MHLKKAQLISLLNFIFTLLIIVNDGFATDIIFRPGPGLNDGTDTGSINAGKDAYAAPTATCGAASGIADFIIGSPRSTCNECNHKAYIQFDISSLPDNVSNVYLGVTHNPHTSYCYSNCVADFYIYPVTEPWNEITIGTNGQPLPTELEFGEGPIHITFPNNFGQMEYDITSIYRAWKMGLIPNHGLAIYSPTSGCNNAAVSFNIASSDHPDESKRPYLRIVPMSQTVTNEGIITLGGVPAEGNLEVGVFNYGRIGIKRYISGQWQEQIFGWNDKASKVQYIDADNFLRSYSVGGYYSGTVVQPISSQKIDNSTVRTVMQAGLLNIVQDVTYVDNSSYIGLRWTLKNTSDNITLTDISFFHGEDTFFYGDDLGAGFWDNATQTIGVQKHIPNIGLRRMSLQAITPPYAYESRFYWDVRTSVSTGELQNILDEDERVDNGYALQWRKSSLAPQQEWSIVAYEKFADVAITNTVYVIAPTVAECQRGIQCNLNFTISNAGGPSQTLYLTTETNIPNTWQISPVPTQVNIAADGQLAVNIALIAPLSALNNETYFIRLKATTDNVTFASDTATAKVIAGGQKIVQMTLSPGWSFMSMPFALINNSITEVFKDNISSISIIWGYNNENKTWQSYKPSTGQGTLTTFETGKGYWIYTMSHATFNLLVNDTSTPTPLTLYSGWNLIGYQGEDNKSLQTVIPAHLTDKWMILWDWDNGAWRSALNPIFTPQVPAAFKPQTGDIRMFKGKAYWIRLLPTSGTVTW